MHVCFVNMPFEYYSGRRGGAVSTIIERTAASLLAMHHDVSVVSWTDEHAHATGDVRSLGDFRSRWRIPRGAWSRLRGAPSYQRLVLRRLRSLASAPDVVVVFNDYSSASWLRPHVPASTRIVTWLQNDERVPVAIWDAGAPDVVVACSEFIRRRAVEQGVPEARTFTVLSGVDTEMFHPRAGWPEREGPLRLLCIGRLDPNKGHDAAVAAAALVPWPSQISLAGATWWYGDTQDAYSAALLRDLARGGGQYLGLVPRDDVPAVFRAHDVCLVLSRSEEPLGLVVLEAMASGLAVIASPRGGLPEACGGAAAALVDPDDVPAVAQAISALAAPEGQHELVTAKRRARERAERQPWSKTAAELLAAASGAGPSRG